MTHPGPAEVNELLRKAVEAVAAMDAAQVEFDRLEASRDSEADFDAWCVASWNFGAAIQAAADASIALVRTLAQPAAAGEADRLRFILGRVRDWVRENAQLSGKVDPISRGCARELQTIIETAESESPLPASAGDAVSEAEIALGYLEAAGYCTAEEVAHALEIAGNPEHPLYPQERRP